MHGSGERRRSLRLCDVDLATIVIDDKSSFEDLVDQTVFSSTKRSFLLDWAIDFGSSAEGKHRHVPRSFGPLAFVYVLK